MNTVEFYIIPCGSRTKKNSQLDHKLGPKLCDCDDIASGTLKHSRISSMCANSLRQQYLNEKHLVVFKIIAAFARHSQHNKRLGILEQTAAGVADLIPYFI